MNTDLARDRIHINDKLSIQDRISQWSSWIVIVRKIVSIYKAIMIIAINLDKGN